MNIFITGATGFIGFNVAKAMRRAGYSVWGLTRSIKKSRLLEKAEICPVIGNMDNPKSYRNVAQKADILIHAAADYQHDTVALDKKTVQTFISIRNESTLPSKIIYTSGCWVHGNTGSTAVNENTPLTPIEAVSWRPAIEQAILQANGVVIRPGCVYGRRGGLTANWFDGAVNQQNLRVIGDGSNYWTMVHVNDLTKAYVRIAESAYSGEIFDVSDHSRWTVAEMAQAVAKVTDYKNNIHFVSVAEAAKELGAMAEALALNQHIDASKARNWLGWEPRHQGFVNEAETFFSAWKAYNP